MLGSLTSHPRIAITIAIMKLFFDNKNASSMAIHSSKINIIFLQEIFSFMELFIYDKNA